MKDSVYLNDIPLEQALNVFYAALEKAHLWRRLEDVTIKLNENAAGRVLSAPIWAKISSPHFHASAMDGFAVTADATAGALPTHPIILKTKIDAWYVDTGDPLPAHANAVIPIEQIEPIDEYENPTSELRRPYAIRIRAAVSPWAHVRPVGEDMVATQLVFPAGQVLRAIDLGAIAACGHSQVTVSRKPKVAVIPTGSELVEIGTKVKTGDLIEFNSIVLAAQINTWGGIANRFEIIPDSFEAICSNVVKAARESDLVLLNAGSSAGSEDFSSQVVQKLGELLVHGIAVRPGHPVILGMIHVQKENHQPEKHVPIIGVPGYPVSAALTGEIIVEPLIAKWLGRKPDRPEEVEAILTKKVISPSGDDDYLRVVIGEVNGKRLAAPISRGAGVISSLTKADGITIIPRGTQGVEAGEKIKVRLYRNMDEIEKTILAIGSHDMTLDVAAQFLSEHDRRLVSANVGSQAGLIAIKKHETHIAGMHLLDPVSGKYNFQAVADYLTGEHFTLLHWVEREQGLMVAKGNPSGIRSLEDIPGGKITYINRQRGAGTRVLLDYHLKLLNIASSEIKGYEQEEYTHLSVAAAVASGRADCGMGIAAAATALDIDFIPLFQEQYDLVILEKDYGSQLLAPLLTLTKDNEFKKLILRMPGYQVSHMGEVALKL
jgi:putative molybdopterin biosynthesis protein